MSPKPSAATNLNTHTEKYLAVTAIVTVLSTLLAISGIYFSFQHLKTYYALKQETTALESSRLNTQELFSFVSDHAQEIERINDVFPNETTIDIVYQNILTLAKKTDSGSTLSFNSLVPAKQNNQTMLPMTLDLRAPHYEVINLLTELERLPYIIEIISIELTNPASLDGHATIQFRLYVDEKFHQS
jgi:hypothetical protein